MVEESILEITLKAIRVGKLALIRPVMTSTEGLWVASTMWIPAALPFWARRMIDVEMLLDMARSFASINEVDGK